MQRDPAVHGHVARSAVNAVVWRRGVATKLVAEPGFGVLLLPRAIGRGRRMAGTVSCCALFGVALIEPMTAGGQHYVGWLAGR